MNTNRKITTSLPLEDYQYDYLKQASAKSGKPMTQFVRDAIDLTYSLGKHAKVPEKPRELDEYAKRLEEK